MNSFIALLRPKLYLLFILLCPTFFACHSNLYLDHLSGNMLNEEPFFHHREVFVEGENLDIALDPNWHPERIGTHFNAYIIEHKSLIYLMANRNLAGISVSVKKNCQLKAGSLAQNTFTLWEKMALTSNATPWYNEFDIILDFNQNGRFDPKIDLIDRVGQIDVHQKKVKGGFTLIKRTNDHGNYPAATLAHRYDFGEKLLPSVPHECRPVDDDFNVTIHRKGLIYYPDFENTFLYKSPKKFPLVIIAQGRTASRLGYYGYEHLGQLLASRGYICVSVDLSDLNTYDHPFIYQRGLAILEHIRYFVEGKTNDSKFEKIRQRTDLKRIGLLGHSRGGEGIIAAQKIWKESNDASFTIKGLVSIAPFDSELTAFGEIDATSCGPFIPEVPFLVINGTRDCDLGYGSGYKVFDQVTAPKFGITLIGADHNYINSQLNKWVCPEVGLSVQECRNKREVQQASARAYALSFLNMALKDEMIYLPFFTGHVQPPALKDSLYQQLVQCDYHPGPWEVARLGVLDDFEDTDLNPCDPDDPRQFITGINMTRIQFGGIRYYRMLNATCDDCEKCPISVQGFVPTDYPGLGSEKTIMNYGSAMEFYWKDQSQPELQVQLGETRDITYYKNIQIGFGQRYRHEANFNPPNAQDVEIQLIDAIGGTSPWIRLSSFYSDEIFYPDTVTKCHGPAESYLIKSIMQSVVIPLRAFTSNGSELDLQQIVAISLKFSKEDSGEMILDDLAFGGVDILGGNKKGIGSGKSPSKIEILVPISGE